MGFAFLFSSCDKDDDVLQVSGKKFQTTYVKVVMNGTTVEFKTKADLEKEHWYYIIEFNTDGKIYINGQVTTSKYSQSGSTITITGEESVKKYTISGNDITVTDTETEDGVTITTTMKYTKM